MVLKVACYMMLAKVLKEHAHIRDTYIGIHCPSGQHIHNKMGTVAGMNHTHKDLELFPFIIVLRAIYFTVCTLEKFQCARATLCALVMVVRMSLNDGGATEKGWKISCYKLG